MRAVTTIPDTVLAGGDGGVQVEHWEREVRWDVQSSQQVTSDPVPCAAEDKVFGSVRRAVCS